MYLVALVLFTLPRLYAEYHEFIDKYVGIAYNYVVANIQKVIALIKEKLPPQVGPIKIKNA
jgi:hypothetical protein